LHALKLQIDSKKELPSLEEQKHGFEATGINDATSFLNL